MLFMDRSLIIIYVSKFCFDGGTSNKLGAMPLRENFFKMVRFGVYFDQILSLKIFKNYHFLCKIFFKFHFFI